MPGPYPTIMAPRADERRYRDAGACASSARAPRAARPGSRNRRLPSGEGRPKRRRGKAPWAGTGVHASSRARRQPLSGRSLGARLGLVVLLICTMAATPGALQARQSSANLARRETVWSVVGSRLWISDEDVSDQTFVGVHIASIAPRRMGMDLGLMFVPDFSDGVGFSGDLGLAYPLRTSSGLLFVPRAGLSMLLLLPELGWTGPHAGGGAHRSRPARFRGPAVRRGAHAVHRVERFPADCRPLVPPGLAVEVDRRSIFEDPRPLAPSAALTRGNAAPTLSAFQVEMAGCVGRLGHGGGSGRSTPAPIVLRRRAAGYGQGGEEKGEVADPAS